MRYFVARHWGEVPASDEPVGLLIHDSGWNDWYKYRTQYNLLVKVGDKPVSLGAVKVGQVGMTPDLPTAEIPPVFERLDERFFSLGQNEDFYETAVRLLDEYGIDILSDLRDIAKNHQIYAAVSGENVLHESLMRYISMSQVDGRFHRLSLGDAKLTDFSFAHLPKQDLSLANVEENNGSDGTISFIVKPSSSPPSNIHVVIGRNGVGKTTRLTAIINSLLGLADKAKDHGKVLFYEKDIFTDDVNIKEEPDFANLISVSFSAFDPFVPPSKAMISASKIGYSYIGLKRPISDRVQNSNAAELPETYSRGELTQQFVDSAYACRKGLRGERWASALAILEADPLFAEAKVRELLSNVDDDDWKEKASRLFRLLSSGHGVVLLTMTRLVELVDERSLVLLDEPEGHLHPPLLSAFVRALSGLLTKRNGVAIIATHSPVVLQEVPRSCVWYMFRSGHDVWADRPERETFAENVGVLTRDVFGLEVNKSGFHQLIENAAKSTDGTFDAILERFGSQLGGEGMALARAMSLKHSKKP